jgi:hypothetical protein
VLIAAGPFLLAFATWTITSWVIVGSPFEQFSSVYGNSSQIASNGGNINGGVMLAAIQAWFLEPLAVVALLASLAVAIRRKDPRVFAVLSITLPIYGFVLFGVAHHLLFGWMRFSILVIPTSVLCFGVVLSEKTHTVRLRRRRALGHQLNLAARGIVSSLLLLGIALPVATEGMLNPSVGIESAGDLRPLVAQHGRGSLGPIYVEDAEIASYLDHQHLARGSVLIDTFNGWPIVANSDNPTQFVITSDRDFQSKLSDPVGAGLKYLLVPDPRAGSQLDAVNRLYPGIYDSGAGIAVLDRQFYGGWRLYEIKTASRNA